MNTPTNTMRQAMWGLSNGILVLGVFGILWFTLAAWSVDWALTGTHYPLHSPWLHGPFLPWGCALIGIAAAAVIAGAVRVRRKAMGFRAADLKNGSLEQRQQTRKIRVMFRWVGLAQILLCWLCARLGSHFGRFDLIWPGWGLVVSLHFVPLAWVFRVRPYYVTAAAGFAVSLLAILIPESSLLPSLRLVLIGSGMGASLWITAVYLIRNPETVMSAWEQAG